MRQIYAIFYLFTINYLVLVHNVRFMRILFILIGAYVFAPLGSSLCSPLKQSSVRTPWF